MPRRIPDYPDAYSGWNAVSSFGSLVSVVATVLFIYIIYNIFVNQNFSTSNPWQIIQYFFGLKAGKDNNIINLESNTGNTIEWTLFTPTPLHAFDSLPVQS